MIRLYIARHGQTEENLQRILQGQMPGHLTPEGIGQAQELRDKLRPLHLDCIYSSDLQRAADTARIVAEAHDCPLFMEPLLRERDFGIHTGGPYIKISRELDPSAETMEQLAQRAADFLNKVGVLPTPSADPSSPCLLAVSHGLFLRVLQAVFHHCDVRQIEKMENAEVRCLEWEPGIHFGTLLQQEVGGTAN